MKIYKSKNNKIIIQNDDVLNLYDYWESPVVIISDGPYGINRFVGDLPTYDGLDKWYEPHIKKWSEKATPQTTLWLWNTEIGWVTIHPVLKKYGWEYINCHTWDKGKGHVAGNANTKTLRKLPIVTEVCVQYSKKPVFKINQKKMSMKEWLRYEWKRTGLPLSKTNEACGIKNAATRKYFTKCHLWYMPPAKAFEKLTKYANEYGEPSGRPYFSTDGSKPISRQEWSKMRHKFKCPYGITNVWHYPPLNGKERIKIGTKSFHLNQKPIELMKILIKVSSDKGDLVWEPFGGLCSATLASYIIDRRSYATEINEDIFNQAVLRFKNRELSKK